MADILLSNFRVIGCGEQSQPVIEQIETLKFNGLKTELVTVADGLNPAADDQMVIILAPDYFEGLDELLKTFYQTGALTLLIAADNFNLSTGICDSRTTVSLEQFTVVVKTLVNALSSQGIVNYDFNDLALTLRNTDNFYVYETAGGFAEAIDAISELSGKYENVENMSLLVTVNRDKTQVRVEEIGLLSNYFATLPEDTNVKWALYNDNTLPSDIIRISVIVAGPKLSMC